MIRLRLREAMRWQERPTGQRVTYGSLAKKTTSLLLPAMTIEAIGSRGTSNPRLSALERLCSAQGCSPVDLIDHTPGSARGYSRGGR